MFARKYPCSALSVRMGHVPRMPNPARITASRNVAHPVLTASVRDLRLLEGVVDRDWVTGMSLFRKALKHASVIPARKKASAFFLLPCLYGVATNSSDFGNGQVWKRGQGTLTECRERRNQIRKRNPTDLRSRCCHSTVGRWTELYARTLVLVACASCCNALPLAKVEAECSNRLCRPIQLTDKIASSISDGVALPIAPRPSEWLVVRTPVRVSPRCVFQTLRVAERLACRPRTNARYTLTASAYAVAPVPPSRSAAPSSGRPAARASCCTRSRASPTRSEKVVSATSWRSVK